MLGDAPDPPTPGCTARPEEGKALEPDDPPLLDVVICTYDSPVLLAQVLEALGAQRARSGWRVTVVTNNSGPRTLAVLDEAAAAGRLPGFRVVPEPVQGLTPARRRGVAATTAPWIAFVDDDCVLDEDWVGEALRFAAEHPDAAGFGGRVVPTYLAPPPPFVAGLGWAFAEQDLGPEPQRLDCLVGAGMVVNREALERSGWTARAHFDDRIGRRLVSGGDVELALRLAATGGPLWYVPACRLAHQIPPERTDERYLRRLVRGLGTSEAMASALTWGGGRRGWAVAALRQLPRRPAFLVRAWRGTGGRARDRRTSVALAASYEVGRLAGLGRVARLLLAGRCEFFGVARRPVGAG